MSDWFVAVDGKPMGPYTAAQLVGYVQAQQVAADAMVWRAGLAEWITAGQAWAEWTVGVAPAAIPAAAPATPATSATDPVAEGSRFSIQGFADRVADLAGVERLEGFRLRELMSASFRRYSSEEIERHFSTGIPENTPTLAQIEHGWPKPWMFVRMLFGTAVLFFGFLIVLNIYPNPKLLPGLIVVGSFAVPMATLVFFFELNSPGNVSLYLVLRCLMLGGLVSIAFALFLFANTNWLNWVGPPLAGVIEEIGKIMTVFVLTARLDPKRYPYILNGMLFGAAVGAGFAAFESAGYAFEIMLSGLFEGHGVNVLGGSINIMLRGLLAPFGHIVWTALVAGALWRVKLDQPLKLKMLLHPRVLRMLATAMVLHATWNLGLLDLPFLLKHWLLGFAAWVLAFSMLQTGLKQIKAAQQSETQGKAELSGATMVFKRVGPIAPRAKT